MSQTQKPSNRYPGARPPMAGGYRPKMLRLPGMSPMNMPKVAKGRKTGVIPPMRKLGKPRKA